MSGAIYLTQLAQLPGDGDIMEKKLTKAQRLVAEILTMHHHRKWVSVYEIACSIGQAERFTKKTLLRLVHDCRIAETNGEGFRLLPKGRQELRG